MQESNQIIVLLIQFGGIFHFICAVSHLFFPRIFQWKSKLDNLSEKNRNGIWGSLTLMNCCQLIFWLIFAYIPLFYAEDLITSQLGKVLLTAIVLFWIVRIFILQPFIVGFKTRMSKLQVVFFTIGLILFLIPWIITIF
jgi:hypothetical protein